MHETSPVIISVPILSPEYAINALYASTLNLSYQPSSVICSGETDRPLVQPS